MSAAGSGALWAITSYFNPLHYRRRRDNYRVFRERLGVPLLTVEMASPDGCELAADDADILVRIEPGDLLWQKERLLNVALPRLPDSCRAVAWLDCDIWFADDDWPARTLATLADRPLAQLFSEVRYLGTDWRPGDSGPPVAGRIRPALAAGIAGGMNPEDCFRHPSPAERPGTYANGLAWAARRALLARHGFYDAAIIGGGDRALACAAWGSFGHVVEWHSLNAHQVRHYRAWAEPFHADCRGQVGVLPGAIYHLWHGDIAGRGLGRRHEKLAAFGLDPHRDIAADEGGAWRWASDKPALHAYVAGYFSERREDG